jgi:hypothetical protein
LHKERDYLTPGFCDPNVSDPSGGASPILSFT